MAVRLITTKAGPIGIRINGSTRVITTEVAKGHEFEAVDEDTARAHIAAGEAVLVDGQVLNEPSGTGTVKRAKVKPKARKR